MDSRDGGHLDTDDDSCHAAGSNSDAGSSKEEEHDDDRSNLPLRQHSSTPSSPVRSSLRKPAIARASSDGTTGSVRRLPSRSVTEDSMPATTPKYLKFAPQHQEVASNLGSGEDAAALDSDRQLLTTSDGMDEVTRNALVAPSDLPSISAKPLYLLRNSESAAIAGDGAFGDDVPTGAKTPGSVHSRGSGASGGTSNSVTQVLRRTIVQQRQRMETSLMYLRIASFFYLLIALVLAIVSSVMSATQVNNIAAGRDLLQDSNRRLENLYRMQSRIGVLQMFNGGFLTASSPAVIAAIHGTLLRYAEEFGQLHRHMYKQVENEFPQEVDEYTGSAYTVYDPIPGTYDPVAFSFDTLPRPVGLANMGLNAMTIGQALAHEPGTSIVFSNPLAYWVRYNALASMHD
ncbi:hypothetical protein EON62_05105, partial [archaeon]